MTESKPTKLLWQAPAAVAGYLCGCALLLASFNLNLPAWLEAGLSLLIAPGLFALLAPVPLLKAVGLASGDGVAGPSLAGFVLLVVSYALVARGLVTAWLWLAERRR